MTVSLQTPLAAYADGSPDFDPTFVPEFCICVNPLCRRKWKRLARRSLPLFCPSCKKSLDMALAADPTFVEEQRYGRSLQFWHGIYRELESAIGVTPCGELTLPKELEDVTMDSVMDVYTSVFPAGPQVSAVRNWSSMGQRKKEMIGTIVGRVGERVWEMAVLEEIPEYEQQGSLRGPDLTGQLLHVIDWRGVLRLGDKLTFVAFPNPSVSERRNLQYVLKILDSRVNPHTPDQPTPQGKSTGLKPDRNIPLLPTPSPSLMLPRAPLLTPRQTPGGQHPRVSAGVNRARGVVARRMGYKHDQLLSPSTPSTMTSRSSSLECSSPLSPDLERLAAANPPPGYAANARDTSLAIAALTSLLADSTSYSDGVFGEGALGGGLGAENWSGVAASGEEVQDLQVQNAPPQLFVGTRATATMPPQMSHPCGVGADAQADSTGAIDSTGTIDWSFAPWSLPLPQILEESGANQ